MSILKPLLYTAISLLLCYQVVKHPLRYYRSKWNPIHQFLQKRSLTEDETQRWSHADLGKRFHSRNEYRKAYQFLEGKKGRSYCAYCRFGVDVEHEDLKECCLGKSK